MGQCCNYAPQDKNAKTFGNSMQLADMAKNVKIDNQELMKAYYVGKKHEASVIKIQA